MHVVVPLAGPDFERADGLTKAEVPIGGEPLLRMMIESRPWWRDGTVNSHDFTFVLRDSRLSRSFQEKTLVRWYPDSKVVFLGGMTLGAALSALAGVSLVCKPEEPLCVDLADILYDAAPGIPAFPESLGVAAKALVFKSDNPAYSYLRVDRAGEVVEVAEKRVISEYASAGTYFFADVATYLSALGHNLRNPRNVTYRGAFYVAPILQGIIDAGQRVALSPVNLVFDPKSEA